MTTNWYNRATYNPASIARINYLYLFTNVRQQWVNLAGSPRVINIQASAFNDKLKSAFGISLVSDQIGISQAINPLLTYAYRISNNENTSLSMGISAGIFGRTYNGTLFDPLDDDPLLNSEINHLIRPDVNIGAELNTRYLTAGLSTTHLLSIFYNDTSYLNTNHRYAYLIFKNTDLESLNFYAGIQYINRRNLNIFEISTNIRFKKPTGLKPGPNELFDIGVSYRTTKILAFILGWNLSENFRIGYSYEQSFIPGFTQYGSHEIMLEYRIPLKSATCIPCANAEYEGWYR